MPENLPASLQGLRFESEGFSYNEGSGKTEATFESGKSYAKLNNAETPARFSGAIVLTYDQVEVFRNFYKTTLAFGTKSFLWNDPISDAAIEVKVIGNPAYSYQQGNYYILQINSEIVQVI